jgi:predicted HD phosphohydrolase
MSRLSSLEALVQLYAERGGRGYGEGISQLEHALQCADLAEAQAAPPSLIVAALLHDVGHLFEAEADVILASADHRHELAGARALGGLFGLDVRGPIALHVAAKRYLSRTEAGYAAALSPASQASLALQGGPFEAGEAAAFERRPYWREAVALRRLDDAGKREEPCGRAFAEFLPMMRELQVRGA